MKNQKDIELGSVQSFFTILGLIYIAPIIIVLFNSFKKKSFINLEPFKLPSAKNFIGLDNYTTALNQYGLLKAVGWTVIYYCGFCYRYSDLYFYVRMGNYPSEE